MWSFFERKTKAKEAMVQGLKEIKRGRKAKVDNSETAELKAENELLRATLCDQTTELTLLKKTCAQPTRIANWSSPKS